MSDCRRKYSELSMVEIPCARLCNAQRVRTVPDERYFFDKICGPLGEGLRGTWGLPLSQGSAPRTLPAPERSITIDFD
jgi:hypothetical protein